MSELHNLQINCGSKTINIEIKPNPCNLSSIIVPTGDFRHGRVILKDVEYDMRNDTYYVYVGNISYVV